ncbi:hypothetical protein FHX36_000072 [Modestobacter versicolor]|uniref:Uncharacterized protein n=1 Tax=Modestobacter versicolor TaxID=429133 RepID=A0A839XWE2_9ACTN|nr:hypothetical protein [Modestobacter versicolor]
MAIFEVCAFRARSAAAPSLSQAGRKDDKCQFGAAPVSEHTRSDVTHRAPSG